MYTIYVYIQNLSQVAVEVASKKYEMMISLEEGKMSFCKIIQAGNNKNPRKEHFTEHHRTIIDSLVHFK